MITRIVKLTFEEDKVNDFLNLFETIKWNVAKFPGCRGMNLLKDNEHSNIFFTVSVWENDEALNNYKGSELFWTIWPTLKIYFKEKAEAWTLSSYFCSTK
ncbi:MAG: antibiotic biosynthesis monooxygenase [Bacteroidetes bacterium]|nr:antibiotic biosynthesis monooxygenase [Bacteroidota bacterium]